VIQKDATNSRRVEKTDMVARPPPVAPVIVVRGLLMVVTAAGLPHPFRWSRVMTCAAARGRQQHEWHRDGWQHPYRKQLHKDSLHAPLAATLPLLERDGGDCDDDEMIEAMG
jgi:hypothetical protein